MQAPERRARCPRWRRRRKRPPTGTFRVDSLPSAGVDASFSQMLDAVVVRSNGERAFFYRYDSQADRTPR